MRELCDISHVVLLDEVVALARMRWSAEAAAGVEELSDPADAVTEFESRLSSPLDTEQVRARMLAAVRSA